LFIDDYILASSVAPNPPPQPGQVRLVFGPGVLTYTQGLCQGRYDYLERLPNPLLLHVLAYLELEEVGQLGQTSQRFRKVSGPTKNPEISACFADRSVCCVLSCSWAQ